ncbi:hypothetical protein [Sphingopyxis sp. PET50]|uniref:hypothetical protein n=1 Tax=Sphingopyxis sp. PET50 TaxID=2976533 RepID=UPI0021AF065A|nr:hypothetical protein [Sphingopyxis sp. PET50]
MTGGLSQFARVSASFSPFTGFDPCDGDDPRVDLSRDNPCQPMIAPAEDLQADPDLEPVITLRFGLGLLALSLAMIGVHWVWSAGL